MTSTELQATGAGAAEEPEARTLGSSDLLIHIGLRKSGTNWLRHNLFGRDDRGFCVPGDMTIPGPVRGRAFKQLFMDSKDRLVPDEEFDAEALRKQLDPLVVPAGKRAVFTAGRLGGHPFSNGFDRGQICNRIKQVFPNARILIVIREQRSMILSSYIEHLECGGGNSLKRYIDGKSDTSSPTLTYHFFKYDRLVRLYQSAFGAENVLMLPMEMIGAAPQDYIDRICKFVNIDSPENMPFQKKANERKTYFPYVALRRIVPLIRSSRINGYSPSLLGRKRGRKFQRKMLNAMSKVVPRWLDERAKKRLQQQIEDLTKDTYVASNRELEKLIGLDLGAFGYRV